MSFVISKKKFLLHINCMLALWFFTFPCTLLYFQLSLFFLLFIIYKIYKVTNYFSFITLLSNKNQAWNSPFHFWNTLQCSGWNYTIKGVVACLILLFWMKVRGECGWLTLSYHIFSCVISGFYTPGNSNNLYVPFCFKCQQEFTGNTLLIKQRTYYEPLFTLHNNTKFPSL